MGSQHLCTKCGSIARNPPEGLELKAHTERPVDHGPNLTIASPDPPKPVTSFETSAWGQKAVSVLHIQGNENPFSC